tara:strand:- start:14643 stop:14828 length:186 start_codon:yes stop_codon:yes gene_type:complete
MQVKYKKNHLDKKAGDVVEVDNDQRTAYLIRVGVIEEVEVKESKPAKKRKTKELKTGKNTK